MFKIDLCANFVVVFGDQRLIFFIQGENRYLGLWGDVLGGPNPGVHPLPHYRPRVNFEAPRIR